MSTIYLIHHGSREDELTFVGRQEDFLKLVKHESGVSVEYPNSTREVYVSFCYDDNPSENELVIKSRNEKNSTWRGHILLAVVALLGVYGFYSFVRDIISLI